MVNYQFLFKKECEKNKELEKTLDVSVKGIQGLRNKNKQLKKQIGQLQDIIVSKDEINGARLRVIEAMRNCLNCEHRGIAGLVQLDDVILECNNDEDEIMYVNGDTLICQHWKQKDVKDGE